MSITSYNTTYHDDYISSGNDDKNYLRVLFKPGYSVQVRELNQLQSSLQDQINRLGNSVWKADTAVIGGSTSFLPEVFSLTLDLSTAKLNVAGSVLTLAEIAESAKSIAYIGSTLRGEIVGYVKREDAKYTFYFNYTNTDENGISVFDHEVPNGYELILRSSDASLPESELPIVNIVSYVSEGFASGLVCEEGVFYTKGSFVAIPRQTFFIDKTPTNESLTGYAVLKIDENITTYFDDSSLLDNANGTPNYSAPGADRYSIDLTLDWITSDDYENSTDSYIKLLVIKASRPVEIVETAKYTEIIDILAKRTSEESGNYTVNPFPIGIRETFDGDNLPVDCIVVGRKYRIQDLGATTGQPTNWVGLGATEPASVGSEFTAVLKPGSGNTSTTAFVNGGKVSDLAYPYGAYQADNLDQIGYDITSTEKKVNAIENARDQYTVTLDSSVAYVDGYRVALNKSLNVTSKKARDETELLTSISATIGSYFIGSIQKGNDGNSTFPTISTVTNTYGLYAYENNANIATTAAALATAVALPTDSPPGTGTAVKIGTCRIKAFESVTGSNMYRCFVYDVEFTGTSTAEWNARRFDNVEQIYGSNFMFNIDTANSGTLLEATNDTAIFQCPYPQSRQMSNTTFYAQRLFTGTLPSSGTPTITLSVSSGIIFTDTSNVLVMVNGVIATSTTISMSSDSSTLTITGTGVTTDDNYSVLAKIAVTNADNIARVTKSREIVSDTVTGGGTNGKIFSLQNTDVIRIVSVETTGPGSAKDITSLFKLIDDGQRDNIYTNARVQYSGLPFTEPIAIEYEYYERIGDVTAREFVMYNVDSYRSNNNSVGTAYENIPTYKGVNLSNAIDFRHDVVYTVVNGATTTIKQNLGKSQIDPNTPITSLTKFYLPRIDAVTVNSRGQFTIVNGVSSLTPVEPSVPKNSMTLYTLKVPAYTTNASDIVKTYIDNRRYTMSDIGAIEKRISNMEYYTSLSLLERSATEKNIFDDAGTRFKNGILVDNFIGHGVGNVFNPDYSCSTDRENGILRPRYNSYNADLAINSQQTSINGSTSKLVDNDKIRVHDSIITLNYNEVELISHLKATAHISVHPHVYAKINGHIRLSPAADNWKDTVTRPDLIVTDDSAFDAIKFIAEDPALDILGSDWNNWEREWGGTTTTTTWARVERRRGLRTTTTTREFTDTREGTNTTLGSTFVPKSLGTNVVDTVIIPFIRSRIVYFHATGLKASTRVYPFFEDRDITAYTNQVDGNDTTKFVVPSTINDNSTRIFNNILSADLPTSQIGYTPYGAVLTTDSAGELYGSFIIPNNSSMRFRTGERIFKLTDDSRNTSSETSYAFSKYTASGILETAQETILSTKTPQFTVTPIEEEERSSSVTSVTTTAYHDPLAQSFIISTDDYPTGAFITSVDLYFAQKALFQPVEIYIVTMANGAPTRTIVPYSRTFRRPGEVQISTDGSLPTNFKFSDPVFLKTGEEYSIIVSSNDGDYRCWYAILGETDIVSGKRIEKQEYLGTFFTSANAYTWTPQQEQDLKFRINRAEFFNTGSTSASGNIQFRTNLHSGIDKITIETAGAGYGLPPTITFNPPTGGARASAVLNPINGSISEIILHDRGSGYTVAPTVNVTRADSDSEPTTPARTRAKLLEIPVSMFNLRQPSLTFNGTAIDYSIEFKAESPKKFQTAANIYLPSSYGNLDSHTLKVIGQNQQFGPRALITANLTTADRAISPIIDVDGSSLLAITNLINSDSTDEAYTLYQSGSATGGSSNTLIDTTPATPWAVNGWVGKRLKITSGEYDGKVYEIVSNTANIITFYPANLGSIASGVTYQIINATSGGSALARYITRKVTLNSPADWLNVYISTNRPTDQTNIKVYVKLGFDTTTPDDLTYWQELTPGVPIPISSDPNKYSESEYKIDPNDDFISFQVKIVLLSNNIFDIPTIRDFRAIATV